jgi:hypothetical protein
VVSPTESPFDDPMSSYDDSPQREIARVPTEWQGACVAARRVRDVAPLDPRPRRMESRRHTDIELVGVAAALPVLGDPQRDVKVLGQSAGSR